MSLYLAHCHNPLGLSRTSADVWLLTTSFISSQNHHNHERLLESFSSKECIFDGQGGSGLCHQLLVKQDCIFTCYRIRQISNRGDETPVSEVMAQQEMSVTDDPFYTCLTQVRERPLVFKSRWSGGNTHGNTLQQTLCTVLEILCWPWRMPVSAILGSNLNVTHSPTCSICVKGMN